MTGVLFFLLAIALIVVVVAVLVYAHMNPQKVSRLIPERFKTLPEAEPDKPQHPDPSELPVPEDEPDDVATEKSKAELEKLQEIIEDQKQVARDADISHHLWGLYEILLQYSGSHSVDRYFQTGEWFEVKILKFSTKNSLNEITFDLKGTTYTFVNDEESQGWSLNIKSFSLFLYDHSGRCLIEVPMKLRVDSSGRNYAVASGGPEAFLNGDWIKDFINVKLKHQSILNQEIRAQKHRERLREIEELKDRFGIRG